MPRRREVHLVTGGGGYPGYSLGKQLALSGHNVILLDVRAPVWPLPDSVTFVQASVTNKDEIDKAFRGVNCVYHMASYGMSGREQLNKKLIEAVNIGGTENVIQACLKNNIHRLVYTSTYNVVFGGQEIRDGDESLPYLPLNKAGQAYFLSDNSPINTLKFFQPLIEGLGYKMPKFSIPVKLMYFIAFITEWIHYIVARIYNFQPLLTRTEVYKSCVTHYFSIGKAQRELGYTPTKVNSIAEVLQHYIKWGQTKEQLKRQRKQSKFTYFLVNIIIALMFASIIMSFLPGAH